MEALDTLKDLEDSLPRLLIEAIHQFEDLVERETYADQKNRNRKILAGRTRLLRIIKRVLRKRENNV